MKIDSLLKPVPKSVGDLAKLAATHWILLESDLLKENIVIIYDKRHLATARKDHPTLAIYFPQEIRELESRGLSPEDLKAIHLTKKATKSWILSKAMIKKNPGYLPVK